MESRECGDCTTGRCYRVRDKTLIEMDGWALINAKDVDDQMKEPVTTDVLVSYMWHECEALKFEYWDDEIDGKESEIRYLDPEDSQMGKCWYCMMKAPAGLKTLWTIHNMGIMHQLPDPYTTSWEPKYLTGRIEDIARNKKNAREAGCYDG